MIIPIRGAIGLFKNELDTMASYLKNDLLSVVAESFKGVFDSHEPSPVIELEIPADRTHGDYACNIALKSARIFRKPPIQLAEDFRVRIENAVRSSDMSSKIEKIEVKHPGFINFHVSRGALFELLESILRNRDDFGRSYIGNKKKVQIEFVSANPTGPLSVAHARQAAVGDALGNVLVFAGFDVGKEFYVNDEGNQINLLGKSVECRARESFGQAAPLPEGGYQGDYIRDMAAVFCGQRHISKPEQLDAIDPAEFSRFAVDYLLNIIKKELKDFGVRFDQWSHQSEVASEAKIKPLIKEFQQKGLIYEQDGALWFKSTDFGDDKDRVVQKSDGSYTYFTPDIVYHRDKFKRGFDWLINIWGPDHHGYIPRLTAAVEALGRSRDALKVLIVQLATIYRGGEPIQMSTRRGQYISLREVMDEVGGDAARYFFLMRHTNAHLDFDLELAKKETPENPVYYIQYAHARIHSIFARAAELDLPVRKDGFQLLKEPEELDLIRQTGLFPDVVQRCCGELDPYQLADYLLQTATQFHRFYDRHKVINPEERDLSSERLALIEAVKITLANGLRLLGVTTPEKM